VIFPANFKSFQSTDHADSLCRNMVNDIRVSEAGGLRVFLLHVFQILENATENCVNASLCFSAETRYPNIVSKNFVPRYFSNTS